MVKKVFIYDEIGKMKDDSVDDFIFKKWSISFKNQTELFNHLWNTKPHVSEISGCLLFGKNHPMWHWQFSHVLSKGAFPRFKLNEKNIVLMTPSEHTLLTEHPEKTKLLPEWKTYWEEYELLRIEYFKK